MENITEIKLCYQIPMWGVGSILIEKPNDNNQIQNLSFYGFAEGYYNSPIEDSINIDIQAFNDIYMHITELIKTNDTDLYNCGCNYSVALLYEDEIILEVNQDKIGYNLFVSILIYIQENYWSELSNYIA